MSGTGSVYTIIIILNRNLSQRRPVIFVKFVVHGLAHARSPHPGSLLYKKKTAASLNNAGAAMERMEKVESCLVLSITKKKKNVKCAPHSYNLDTSTKVATTSIRNDVTLYFRMHLCPTRCIVVNRKLIVTI